MKLSKGFVEKLEHNSFNFKDKLTVQIGKHVYAFLGGESLLSVSKYQNIAYVTAGCSPAEEIKLASLEDDRTLFSIASYKGHTIYVTGGLSGYVAIRTVLAFSQVTNTFNKDIPGMNDCRQ